MAARFNDDGVTALYQALKVRLGELGMKTTAGRLPVVNVRHSTHQNPVVPGARTRYLAEISYTVRGYKQRARAQARLAREIQQLRAAAAMLQVGKPERARAAEAAIELAQARELSQDPGARQLLAQWPAMQQAYAGDEYVVRIRDKDIRTALTTKSLSGTTIRKVALPQYEDHGEILKWLMLDNVPAYYTKERLQSEFNRYFESLVYHHNLKKTWGEDLKPFEIDRVSQVVPFFLSEGEVLDE
jgi:methylmalonyl-CoA mutase